MTLDRYILRLWAGPFFGLLFIVTGVLLFGRVLNLLSLFTSSGVDWGIMWTMLLAITPYFLVITAPVALFFSIQKMLMNLYQSSEMDALKASGVSLLRLLRPIFVVVIALWVLLSMMAMEWMPQGVNTFQLILTQIQKINPEPDFEPQRFSRETKDFMVYIEGRTDDGMLHGFILEDRRSEESVLYICESAKLHKDGGLLKFDLLNGYRLEGSRDAARMLKFDRYQVALGVETFAGLQTENWGTNIVGKNMLELWKFRQKSDSSLATAEWHRRFLLPSSVLLMFLFAVPFAERPKRTENSAGYTLGIVVILAVYNVQFLLHRSVQNGDSPWWVMWAGQILFVGVGAWLFMRVVNGQPTLITGFYGFFSGMSGAIKRLGKLIGA